MIRFALLFLLLFASRPGAAHELWLESLESGGFQLHWGHGDGSGHAGLQSLPFVASDVVEVWGAATGAAVRRIDVRADDQGRVRLDDCDDFVALRFDAGTWVKTRRGTVRGQPSTVEGALDSWQSSATVKRIARFDQDTARPRMEGLEISPLDDPAGLEVGDKIDLRVTLGADPIADVVVTYAGRPRGTTERDGTVRLKLRDAGVQRFGASHTIPTVDAAVDRRVYEAFLEFEVGASR